MGDDDDDDDDDDNDEEEEDDDDDDDDGVDDDDDDDDGGGGDDEDAVGGGDGGDDDGDDDGDEMVGNQSKWHTSQPALNSVFDPTPLAVHQAKKMAETMQSCRLVATLLGWRQSWGQISIERRH